MELVLDANILFSALIKSGLTRELMLNTEIIIYTPEFIIEEFLKHLDELENKVNVEKEELKLVVTKLITTSNIRIVPLEEIKEFVKKAEEISPDPDDVLYFATALKLNCGIWSNDKKLKKQSVVKVYSTGDLAEIF